MRSPKTIGKLYQQVSKLGFEDMPNEEENPEQVPDASIEQPDSADHLSPLPVKSTYPCPACDRWNVSDGKVLGPRPSLVKFILFGWIYLIIHHAFATETHLCNACGWTKKTKSLGSIFCLAFVILIGLLLLQALLRSLSAGDGL